MTSERSPKERGHGYVLPTDPESAEAVASYISWLNTSGKKGEQLEASAMDLRGTQISGLQMKSLYLIATDMRDCIFNGCDFTKSELKGALMDGSKFVGTNFYKADLSECSGEGADFTRSSLIGATFYESELTGSIFKNSYINASLMHEIDLRGADMRGVWFGPRDAAGWTTMKAAKLGGCHVAGAGGCIKGSADIGRPGEPYVIGGHELAAWFSQQGAPDVEII